MTKRESAERNIKESGRGFCKDCDFYKSECSGQITKSECIAFSERWLWINNNDDLKKTKHPDYYNKGIEVIKFIESWNLNFSRGSIVKYICRGGYKDKTKEIEDLQKARNYIDFEIERIKRIK